MKLHILFLRKLAIAFSVGVIALGFVIQPVALAQNDSSTLTIGGRDAYTTFNPLNPRTGDESAIMRYVFSKLVTTTPAGPGQEIIPDLGEAWTISEDATVYTFTLRDDVMWQDGQPFTSEDVVFTFNYLLQQDVGGTNFTPFQKIVGAAEYLAGTSESVAGVTANGDYEVTITLNAPSATFMLNLSNQYILPAHVVSQIPPEQWAASDFLTLRPYPGTGPYIFERWVTDQFLELQANASYFRGAPQIDRIVIRPIPDANTRLIAFEQGEIDIVAYVPPEEVERLQQISGTTVVRLPGSTQGLFVNSDATNEDPKKTAMRTPQFRQALLHALDWTIIDSATGGNFRHITCVVRTEWACATDLTEQYPFDVEQSRALLTEIGWDASWIVDLQVVREVFPVHQVMQQLWADVGININLFALDAPTWTENFYDRGTYDLALAGYTNNFLAPDLTITNFLICGQFPPAGQNGNRYCNEQVTALNAEGGATVDATERAEIYSQVIEILHTELPLIPLWELPQIFAAGPRLQNYTLAIEGWNDPHTWTLNN